ncbi:triose-phosphate isomerase [Desulfomicrobium sp. ZS1]|uniref:triose-phosphate isomerase n=1 Tax=Desulfomicrobium sp. ZS1 TaxID=2952228 RepID=UPI0020B1825E|nr:triose-phosphate isomerase [Desulfomicrobium sp. ZS1]UTF51175.1 triose-phosphate isomerase [Desulfomicrobium sp. ZS1]
MRKLLMAANWKMYKSVEEGVATARELVSLLDKLSEDREVLVCPSFIMMHSVCPILAQKAGCYAGAQNFYPAAQGAFTGEVAPEQLMGLGCTHALAGHSERRHVLGEMDELIGRKVAFGLDAGLKMILCVGETIVERRLGQIEEVLARQLESGLAGVLSTATAQNLAVAYEPVWAIGTGEVAGPDEILAAHAFVRATLTSLLPKEGAQIRILYGGSVKPDNAATIIRLDNVDGVLVGGASLKADSFSQIVLA